MITCVGFIALGFVKHQMIIFHNDVYFFITFIRKIYRYCIISIFIYFWEYNLGDPYMVFNATILL